MRIVSPAAYIVGALLAASSCLCASSVNAETTISFKIVRDHKRDTILGADTYRKCAFKASNDGTITFGSYATEEQDKENCKSSKSTFVLNSSTGRLQINGEDVGYDFIDQGLKIIGSGHSEDVRFKLEKQTLHMSFKPDAKSFNQLFTQGGLVYCDYTGVTRKKDASNLKVVVEKPKILRS